MGFLPNASNQTGWGGKGGKKEPITGARIGGKIGRGGGGGGRNWDKNDLDNEGGGKRVGIPAVLGCAVEASESSSSSENVEIAKFFNQYFNIINWFSHLLAGLTLTLAVSTTLKVTSSRTLMPRLMEMLSSSVSDNYKIEETEYVIKYNQ